MMENKIKIKFQKAKEGEFFDTVKSRVDEYFTQNRITRHANLSINLKIFFFLSLYFLLLALIYSNQFSGVMLVLIYSVLGFVTSLICCNFCHDLLHGAYFSSQKINRFLGYLYDINGLSS